MASSINTTGSILGNSSKGLLAANKPQLGNTNQPTSSINPAYANIGKGMTLQPLDKPYTTNITSNPLIGTPAVTSQVTQPGLIPPKAETPLKKTTTTNVDGSTTAHEYHAPSTDKYVDPKTGGSTAGVYKPSAPATPVSVPPPQPTTPQVGTQMQNAQNVMDTGQQTSWEQAAARNLAEAKGLQNYGQFAPTAESQFYGVGGQSQGKLPDFTLPDIVGRAGVNQDLYNKFANLYGTQANVGLQAAQTSAERARGAATSVLGAGAPVIGSAGQVPYNPLTGQQRGILGTTQEGGLFGAGGVQGTLALGQQYPALQSAHAQSQGIKNTIQNYLAQNPDINPVDATAVNNIYQWIEGKQLGDAKYQTLMNYLNEYTSTLAPILGVGGDATNLKTEIAQSFVNAKASGQSITDVLESIDELAQGKLEAMKAVGTGTYNQPSSGSNGGAISWDTL